MAFPIQSDGPLKSRSGLRTLRLTFRLFAACLLLFVCCRAGAQADAGYEDIAVTVNVQGIGGAEEPALIHDKSLYLPVPEIFDFLKIRNTLSPARDSVTGFFIDEAATFVIDKVHSRILFGGKSYELTPGDLVNTETSLYLPTELFGKIFGLECAFSFRSLSVTITTKQELPRIRQLRLEQIRQNLSHLRGEQKADTSVERSFPLFRFGMADWSVISTQQQSGLSDTRLNLTLGLTAAGGEAALSLNYSNNEPFAEKQQFYLWRYVNNLNKNLKQLSIGKIYVPATASIYAPVVGVQVSNTPTTFRRSFGTYTLSNVTKPGWMVELYVNNVLVEYKKAGPSGFFSFEVPIVYGTSVVKLRFYGPWGEEYFREEIINIPFSFIPAKTMEYTASAGIVEDGHYSRFARGQLNYGLNRHITVGGGFEYLSSVTSGPFMPYASASVRLATNLMLTGEYTYGVRTKGVLTYRLPSNLQVELNYTKYAKGQTAINYSMTEERKAIISIPLSTRRFSLFSRLMVDQMILPVTSYTNAEWLLSANVFGITANLNTYASFVQENKPYSYSNLSLAVRLPGKFILTPQVQYDFMQHELISAKCMLEKSIFGHGFLNVSYEQNFTSIIQNIGLGFRYDFSFAQVGASALLSNNLPSVVESARGSLLYDGENGYHSFSYRNSVGKGAIVILPFLDINCNGVRDEGEPKVAGLRFRINGGRVVQNNADTSIRIFELEPYTRYFLELDKNSFENIAWQIRKQTISAATAPNQFTQVEVPVSVVGEVTGTVLLNNPAGNKGQGRIIVNFYNKEGVYLTRALSEVDGFFSMEGLAPGDYTARIDASQLKLLHLEASPAVLPVRIVADKEGPSVNGLRFVLKSRPDSIAPGKDGKR